MNFALKYRPKTLDEVVGQRDIVSKNSPFYKLLKSKTIPHSLFFGPPGSGKTTIAKIVADELEYDFYSFDGSSLKVDEIRKVIKRYENSLIKPLLFIDEIHRLSTNQQEVLLIPMENSSAVIIGASTINPYYSLTSAFRSRSLLFELRGLSSEDLEELLKKVVKLEKIRIEDEAKKFLLDSSGGDARAMLNLLEFSSKVEKNITLATLKSLRSVKIKESASSKDFHYSVISALIKSLRGSDIDASLYYLALLIDGGEEPAFIARRLVIFSCEDIGNANPNALNLAVSTMEAVSKIGYPEARIILSQCVIYQASSPKSNSAYKAINSAIEYVKDNLALEIPEYLIQTKLGYKYPHDFGGFVKQKYISKDLKFYNSKNIGFESKLNEWISRIKGERE